MTFKNRVAVRTAPEFSVARTAIEAGPGKAAALTVTGNAPAVPMVRLPELAVNPAGRFGKSIKAVPVNPPLDTICTVSGRVLFWVTGAGVPVFFNDSTTTEKSGCRV